MVSSQIWDSEMKKMATPDPDETPEKPCSRGADAATVLGHEKTKWAKRKSSGLNGEQGESAIRNCQPDPKSCGQSRARHDRHDTLAGRFFLYRSMSGSACTLFRRCYRVMALA